MMRVTHLRLARHTVLLGLLLGCPRRASAEGQAPLDVRPALTGVAEDDPGLPRLDPPEWNFGVRPQHSLVTREFTLAPPKQCRVTIDRTWTSCRCFTTRILRDQGTAASPAKIEITMDTEEYKGRFRRSVFFAVTVSDAGPSPGPPRRRDIMFPIKGWMLSSSSRHEIHVFHSPGTPASTRLLGWWGEVPRERASPNVRLHSLRTEEARRLLTGLAREAGIERPDDDLIAFFDNAAILRGPEDVIAGLRGFINMDGNGRPDPSPKRVAPPRPLGQAEPPKEPDLRQGARRVAHPRATDSERAPAGTALEIRVYYFSRCRGCREALDAVRRLELEMPTRTHVQLFDIDSDREHIPEVYAMLENYPDVPKELPSMLAFVGDRLLLGTSAISSGVAREAREALALGGEHLMVPAPATAGADSAIAERLRSMSILVIVAAALADGVNPCAFAAMVLLISVLSVSKPATDDNEQPARRLALGGGALCAGVFLTYYAVGMALFKGAGVIAEYPAIEKVVFWSLWSLAGIGGVLSAIDGVVYMRTRDAKRVMLRVPNALRRLMAPLLRGSFRRSGLVIGGFIGGVLIALIEGVCTGQMYLPTIQYMATTPGLRAAGAVYLLLYNALFMLPLVVILSVAVAGVHFRRLSGFLQSHLGAAKLLLAIVFFVLATAMLMHRIG